jgi:hypothetical protein
MTRRLVAVAIAGTALVMGCAKSDSATGPTPAHGVVLEVASRSPAANGTTVSLRIRNTATDAAFLRMCGQEPSVILQRFVDGVWKSELQVALACPNGPPSQSLAASESVVVSRTVTGSGRFRFAADVGSTADLSDAAMASSASFDVP